MARSRRRTRSASRIEKETKVSRTDPEAGYMVREGKPKGFFYLVHRTVDAAHAIITDTHATPVVHDSTVYLTHLERQVRRFDFNVAAVGLDAGVPHPASPRVWRSARSGLARATATRPRRSPA